VPSPAWGYDVHRDRETKQLDLVQRSRKCLFVYQYWQDPQLGWMNARIQTWFPFSIQICLNGREWLARQMYQEGIAYQKQDNCFVSVSDWPRAQQLLDEQLRTDWPALLQRIARRLNPLHEDLFARLPVEYYWSSYQTEWATDVTFHQASDLRRLFPLWLRHAILTFQSADVLKFLGKRLNAHGELHRWQHVAGGGDGARSGTLQSLPSARGKTGRTATVVPFAPRSRQTSACWRRSAVETFSSMASGIGTCNNCSMPSLRKVGRRIAGVPPRSAASSAYCAPTASYGKSAKRTAITSPTSVERSYLPSWLHGRPLSSI